MLKLSKLKTYLPAILCCGITTNQDIYFQFPQHVQFQQRFLSKILPQSQIDAETLQWFPSGWNLGLLSKNATANMFPNILTSLATPNLVAVSKQNLSAISNCYWNRTVVSKWLKSWTLLASKNKNTFCGLFVNIFVILLENMWESTLESWLSESAQKSQLWVNSHSRESELTRKKTASCTSLSWSTINQTGAMKNSEAREKIVHSPTLSKQTSAGTDVKRSLIWYDSESATNQDIIMTRGSVSQPAWIESLQRVHTGTSNKEHQHARKLPWLLPGINVI